MNIMRFYRYEFVQRGPELSEVTVEELTFTLIEETPKGYWIRGDMFMSKKKWIPKQSKKRYAYPTKKEAMESLVIRTTYCTIYLKKHLAFREEGLRRAKFEFENLDTLDEAVSVYNSIDL